MPKHLTRIIALLLVPCLAGDALIPVGAATFGKQGAALMAGPHSASVFGLPGVQDPTIQSTHNAAFAIEALSARGDVFAANKLTRQVTGRLDQQTALAGGYSSRLAETSIPAGYPLRDQNPAERWGAFWNHPRSDWAPYRGRIRKFWEDTFSASRGQRPVQTVLDIGTGNFSVASVARHVLPSAQISAIDSAPLPEHRTPHGIQFRQWAAEDTGFNTASMDLIVSMHGLDYSDLHQSLAEMYRVMRPGGHGVFILHHPEDRDVKSMTAWLEQAGAIVVSDMLEALGLHLFSNPRFSSDTFRADGPLARLEEEIRQRREQGLETGYLLDMMTTVTDLLDTSFSRASAMQELEHLAEAHDLRHFRSHALITAASKFPDASTVRSIMIRHGFAVDGIQTFTDEKGLVGWQVAIHKPSSVSGNETPAVTNTRKSRSSQSPGTWFRFFGMAMILSGLLAPQGWTASQTQGVQVLPASLAPTEPTKDEVLAALNGFETSELPKKIRAARKILDGHLQALIDKGDHSQSAGLETDLPKEVARNLLGTRLYSLYTAKVGFALPAEIRADFETLDALIEKASREVTMTQTLVIPPTLDAKHAGPLSPHEMEGVAKRLQKAKRAWYESLDAALPGVTPERPMAQVLSYQNEITASMRIARDPNGTIHIAQLDERISNAMMFGSTLHQRLRHWVLENGVLRELHEPLRRNVKYKLRPYGLGLGYVQPDNLEDLVDPDLPPPASLSQSSTGGAPKGEKLPSYLSGNLAWVSNVWGEAAHRWLAPLLGFAGARLNWKNGEAPFVQVPGLPARGWRAFVLSAVHPFINLFWGLIPLIFWHGLMDLPHGRSAQLLIALFFAHAALNLYGFAGNLFRSYLSWEWVPFLESVQVSGNRLMMRPRFYLPTLRFDLKPDSDWNRMVYSASRGHWGQATMDERLHSELPAGMARLGFDPDKALAHDSVLGSVFALADLDKPLTAEQRKRLADALAKVESQAFFRSDEERKAFREQVLKKLTGSRGLNSLYVLVSPEGMIKGYACVAKSDEGGEGDTTLELEELATLPEKGSPGKGRYLLGTLLELWRDRGVQSVKWVSQWPSADFYHRFLASEVDYECFMEMPFFKIYPGTFKRLTPAQQSAQLSYVEKFRVRKEAVQATLARLPPGKYRLNSATTFEHKKDGTWQYEDFLGGLNENPEKVLNHIVNVLVYFLSAELFGSSGHVLIPLSNIPNKTRVVTSGAPGAAARHTASLTEAVVKVKDLLARLREYVESEIKNLHASAKGPGGYKKVQGGLVVAQQRRKKIQNLLDFAIESPTLQDLAKKIGDAITHDEKTSTRQLRKHSLMQEILRLLRSHLPAEAAAALAGRISNKGPSALMRNAG